MELIVCLKDVRHDMEENTGDKPHKNPMPGGGGCTGTLSDGSGSGGGDYLGDKDLKDEQERNDEDKGKDSKESGVEHSMDGQNGKDYTQNTDKGNELAKILISFCPLSKSSANAVLVYFGMSTMKQLADFHEKHWKLVQWQKCHTFPYGTLVTSRVV